MNNSENKTILKPCPFCGHDHIETRVNQKGYLPAIIFCNLCGANLSAINTEAAIKSWNTRYLSDKVANIAAPTMFECSGCRWECWDVYYNDSEIKFCPNCGKPVLDRGDYPLFSSFCDEIPPQKRKEIGEENLIAMYVAILDPDAEDNQ